VADAQPLLPGGTVKLAAPASGWVRATLYLVDGTQAVDPGCLPIGQPLSTCSRDLAVAAMTSPLYVGVAPTAEPLSAGPLRAPDPQAAVDEPDDDPPLAAVRQSNGPAPLPTVPVQRTRGSALVALRARVTRRCASRRRAARVRVTWASADRPIQLQIRAPGRWRTLRQGLDGPSATLPAPCRRVTRLRARTRPPGLAPGSWRRVSVRPR
jgi:hypothetical protein